MNLSDYCREVAWRLELNNDTGFRVAAYRKAASILETAGTCDYRELAGIGKSIAADLSQVLAVGTTDRLEKLRIGGPPATLIPMLGIRGIGTSKLMELHSQGISSLDELGAAIKTHQLRDPKLASSYYAYKAVSERFRADLAAAAFQPWLDTLHSTPGVVHADLVGSYKRSRPDLRDLDVLVTVQDPHTIVTVCRLLASLGLENLKRTDFRTAEFQLNIAGLRRTGNIHFCGRDEHGTAELYFTGSKQFGVNLSRYVEKHGGTLGPYVLSWKSKKHQFISEDDVFRTLGLPYVPPECRDNHLDPQSPVSSLVESVCGDFHCHTTASDGRDSVADMVKRAQSFGHCYLGVSDHTHSAGRGMHQPALLDHTAALRKLKSGGIRVLAGVEMDIKVDGSLDHDVSSLSNYDYVILSCHQDPTRDNAARLESAFKAVRARFLGLPLVLAHPTGRLIGTRPESDSDPIKVFQLCAQYNVALEINGQPSRVDLSDSLLMRAKRYRCKFLASSDAHSAEQLRYIEGAVQTGRRALLTDRDIINADPSSIEAWLDGADLRAT